jgi:glutaredoxin
MKVKLEFQYFEGCPNHKKMSDNLNEAIKGLEEKIDLKEALVEDEATAMEVGFIGSPTLLINGEDIAGAAVPESPQLACRFYPGGVPSAEIIRKKIIQKINKEK